jgi:esterase/lipase
LRDIATVEAEVMAAEAQVPDLRPGCQKRIIWAGDAAVRTDFSVLFIHGFSASPEEIRPLPDLVAKALGANLHFTRLTGHGQDGAAMGRATLAAWQADVAEALEIATTIGERVIIVGCSTGCTLATLALAHGATAHAMVHVSPNFGLSNRLAQLMLDLPMARHWSHLIAGRERRFPAVNEAHAAYWTLRYPTQAVHVMADAVRAALSADLASITTPALFCYNETDQVVSACQTRKVIARWGAPVDEYKFIQGPEDDAMGHLMAGDIFSPCQTDRAAARILAWLEALPGD